MKKLLLILPLLIIGAGCSGEKEAIGGSGMIEATEVLVSSETGGRIEQLNFDEGTELTKGDTLLIVDPSRLQLDKNSAEARLKVSQTRLESTYLARDLAQTTLDYAATELERQKKMLSDGTSTQQIFDKTNNQFETAQINLKNSLASINTIKAEIEATEAEIAKIDRVLKDCYPLAPISGVVSKKYCDRGELLSQGKSIAKIIDESDIWVKVYLPAADFSQVKLGTEVKVDTEFEKAFTGKIIWTAQEAEFTPKNVQTKKSRANLVYAVKVKITDNDGTLKVGMPVYVTIGE